MLPIPQILCTRYQLPEAILGGDSDQDARRLWVLSWNGTAWDDARPLVGMLTREGFNQSSRDAFQVDETGAFPVRAPLLPWRRQCRDYVWKFGEWCGWDRFVVVTMYCTDDSQAPDTNLVDIATLASRVMLLDLWADDADGTGNPDAYTDLVSVLEWIHGAEPGSWAGWFATCGRVEGS